MVPILVLQEASADKRIHVVVAGGPDGSGGSDFHGFTLMAKVVAKRG